MSLPPKQDGHPQDRYEYYLVKVVAMWARATAVSAGPYAALTGAHLSPASHDPRSALGVVTLRVGPREELLGCRWNMAFQPVRHRNFLTQILFAELGDLCFP